MLLFASGLTDPELSMAASVHLFAAAGLEFPAAVNGPQYLAGRGTKDPAFRARGDVDARSDGAGPGHRASGGGYGVDDNCGGSPEALPA